MLNASLGFGRVQVRIDDEGSRKLWREAHSFGELCGLGERFLRGEICVFPGWNAPDLDVESDEIAMVLVRLSRAGFLTCASQPARADQRAFVSGFVAEASARRLRRVTTQIVVRCFGLSGDEPHVDTTLAEPVSGKEGRFHAFAGHDARNDELACFEDEIGSGAFVELQRAIYVTAFDPEWGRRDRLWSELTRALELE